MQKGYKIICIAAIICIAMVGGWYWYTSRPDVSDHAGGADTTRKWIESAESGQREENAAISNATDAIRNGQQSNGEIESLERNDAGIIAECQGIIDRIRARGTAENEN